MDKTVLVAIITGFCGLIVALVALFQNTRTSKLQSETQKYIEELKVLSELRYKSIIEASSRTEPILKELDGAWQDSQNIKDSIATLKGPVRTRSQEHIERLIESVDNLRSNYKAHGASLPKSIERIWHEAKNQAISFRSDILLHTDDFKGKENLSDETINLLHDFQQMLTDFQGSLKEWKENYREQEVEKIFNQLSPNKVISNDDKKLRS